MFTQNTYLTLINSSSLRFRTFLSGVDSFDFDRTHRPDKNVHNIILKPGAKITELQVINWFANGHGFVLNLFLRIHRENHWL